MLAKVWGTGSRAESSISLVMVSAHLGAVGWWSALLGFRCMSSAGQDFMADMLVMVRAEQRLMTIACLAVGASTPVTKPGSGAVGAQHLLLTGPLQHLCNHQWQLSA